MIMLSRLLFGPPRPGIEALRPVLYRIAFAWCHDAALADDLVLWCRKPSPRAGRGVDSCAMSRP